MLRLTSVTVDRSMLVVDGVSDTVHDAAGPAPSNTRICSPGSGRSTTESFRTSNAERIRAYAQRIVGEAFTQTGRALDATEGLRNLLGGADAGKRLVLSLLDRHRQRLDRLGIEPVDPVDAEDAE